MVYSGFHPHWRLVLRLYRASDPGTERNLSVRKSPSIGPLKKHIPSREACPLHRGYEGLPQYVVVQQSRIPNTGRPIGLAFLPFTTSTGNPADGAALASRLESAAGRHPDAYAKYRIIQSDALARALGKSDLTRLTPADLAKIRTGLGLEVLMTGHLKSQTESQIAFRIEALDVVTARPRFVENVTGGPGAAADKVVDLLYGKRLLSGTKVETVTKYRTETRTLYRDVEQPYREYVTSEKQVAYDTTDVNWTKTFLLGLLVVIIGASADKK